MKGITRIVLITIIVFNKNFSFAGSKSKSMDLVFNSSKDQIKLNGTLSSPQGISKGAVLMLVGSGKVDRDETTSKENTFSGREEKLFLQLSDALVSAGFTTFRYDKRGILNADGKVDMAIWKTADREHLISDAIDAAKLLLKETNFNVDQLIILGHSEGTILAVETAIALGGKIRGLLLLGAQARSMKEMLYYQIVESRTAQNSEIESALNQDKEKEYDTALKMIETEKGDFAPDGKPMNWYRQYLTAPANEIRLLRVKGNVSIFQGELDPQTPISEIERFKKAGRNDLSIFIYPNLGHGFSPDKNGKPTLGPIDTKVISDIIGEALKF